jgi:ABC-type Fe3+ transport system permease subunit
VKTFDSSSICVPFSFFCTLPNKCFDLEKLSKLNPNSYLVFSCSMLVHCYCVCVYKKYIYKKRNSVSPKPSSVLFFTVSFTLVEQCYYTSCVLRGSKRTRKRKSKRKRKRKKKIKIIFFFFFFFFFFCIQ